MRLNTHPVGNLSNTFLVSQIQRHLQRPDSRSPHTAGHDMAELLQLLGCEPCWQKAYRQC